MRRRTNLIGASALIAVLLLAACGESPLGEVGQRSTDWIGEAEQIATSSTTLPEVVVAPQVAALALTSAASLEWANDGLAFAESDLEAPDVVRDVWRRLGAGDAFVQVHRTDIAAALPGVAFPGAVPSEVEHVTSQLVYQDNQTGRLSDDVVAAFGLWSVKPYSQSRVVGQQAVLMVGLVPTEEPDEGSDDDVPLSLCDAAQIADALDCREIAIDGVQVAELAVADGVWLVWSEGLYRYELFYRTSTDPEIASLIASSMVPLADVEEKAFDAFVGVASQSTVSDGVNPTR